MKKVKVGVVGCGGICKVTYMHNMMYKFAIIDVVGCYDILEERMDYMVDKYGIRKYESLEAICADPEIEVICNLTYPESHFLVSKTAMEHGKHVYCEKMMAGTFSEAKQLCELAEKMNVMYTTAPDTFLGAWEQSSRMYLDQGAVGEPVAVHAQITGHYEPETPFFDLAPRYYFFPLHEAGGFPFDMGGYYIHQMINLFGSVSRVTGFGGNRNPLRHYSNPKHPKYKESFAVDTPTTLMAALEFENGVLGTLFISSDASQSWNFVVTGSDGTMRLGDPNLFSDRIYISRRGANPPIEGLFAGEPPKMEELEKDELPDSQKLGETVPVQEIQLPLMHGFYETSRGVGLADMCYALRNGRRPRAHCDIGLHAIEIIHGIQESCTSGKIYEMTTRCPRPAPLRPSALTKTGWEATLDN